MYVLTNEDYSAVIYKYQGFQVKSQVMKYLICYYQGKTFSIHKTTCDIF
jgi:hypothetical protein